MDTSDFCDSGIVVGEDTDNKYSDYSENEYSGKSSPSYTCLLDLLHTRIPIATWRLAELEFFSTKIPIAKWRLQEFYMEKKSKMYRGTATSFGFKRPASANTKTNNPAIVSAPPPLEQLTHSIESEIITTTARTGTPRLSRPRKETTSAIVKTNRFGFRSPTVLSNKVADSQNDINSTKANLRLDGLEETTKPSLLPQPRSNLPRLQQFPVRLVAPAHYHPRTASADKSAKTAANNNTARRSRSENGGSSASSVNDADSGVGSQKSGGEMDMIEQLECSPSARNRLRNAQKSRPMKMIFTGGNEKKFELRDLKDSIEVTEIVPLELPALRLPQDCGLVRDRAKAYGRQLSRDTHSGSSEDDEGIEDEAGEEKLHRDRVLSEKDERGVVGAGEEAAEGEDLWGHGEAMAGEDDMFGGQDMDSDRDSDGSPGSPGTPTHMSNSLSLSSDIRDRDFIDDEICDQPGLVYGDLTAGNSSGNTLVADERDASPRVTKPLSVLGHLTVDCSSARHSSVGTLSPCESITSDDLIMDFDLSDVNDDHRLDLDTSSLEAAITDGEADGEEVLQELNSLLAARPELLNGVRATRQLRPRVGSSGSGADSPRSLDTPRLRSGSALSSPLRSRQSTSSPGDDISEDSGIRVNRVTYQSMYQDVINIKALLLRLNRVMQESEAENPHGTPQKNGFCGCSGDTNGDASQQELIADLQRQVVFLQSQVEERDRTIRSLQTTQPPEPREKVEMCNAATQTDRVRPLSTGPILSTQPDAAGGSFVSNTNESVRQHIPAPRPVSRLPLLRRATSPSCDLHKSLRKQT